jgi:hypothetical protein
VDNNIKRAHELFEAVAVKKTYMERVEVLAAVFAEVDRYRDALQEVVGHLEIVAYHEPMQITYALDAAKAALAGEPRRS